MVRLIMSTQSKSNLLPCLQNDFDNENNYLENHLLPSRTASGISFIVLEKIIEASTTRSEKLDLSMIKLTYVPIDEINQNYGCPTTLNLSYNLIACLNPRFIFNWKDSLTRLDLSNNCLEMLPNDFGSLSKLTYLDIHRNMVLYQILVLFGKLLFKTNSPLKTD